MGAIPAIFEATSKSPEKREEPQTEAVDEAKFGREAVVSSNSIEVVEEVAEKVVAVEN